MSDEKKLDGGPAFPQVKTETPYARGGERRFDVSSTGGMRLRDYFAGQAIVGLAETDNPKYLAAWAYQLADAMLAESGK